MSSAGTTWLKSPESAAAAQHAEHWRLLASECISLVFSGITYDCCERHMQMHGAP